MASDYRIGVGHDLTLASLTKLNPQCTSEGIRVTQRAFMGDGSTYDQGEYVELVWNVISLVKYQAILAVCGLSSNFTQECTVYCRDELYTYHRYNGRVIRPQSTWQNYAIRNFTLLVRDLSLIS